MEAIKFGFGVLLFWIAMKVIVIDFIVGAGIALFAVYLIADSL